MDHIFDLKEKDLEKVKASMKSEAESEALKHAQAAMDEVEVKEVEEPDDEVKESSLPEPIMPKSLAQKSQTSEKEQPPQTTQSLWESQEIVQHMTKRLTTEKQKTPEEIEREKLMQENAVKQQIRNEILAPEPVSDADTKVYAGYLAQKSQKSKS